MKQGAIGLLACRLGRNWGVGAALLAVLGVAFGAPCVAVEADLSVTIVCEDAFLYRGQTTDYLVTFENAGPADVTGAAATATFSSDFLSVFWTATLSGGASGAASGTGSIIEAVDLPAGGSVAYGVRCTLSSATTADSVMTSALVAAPGGVVDEDPANNSAVLQTPVEEPQIVLVRPVYANSAPSPNALSLSGSEAPANGVTAFGGHVGDWSAPSGGEGEGEAGPRYVLKAASFGQPLAPYLAGPGYSQEIIDRAYASLFYIPGASSAQNNQAAFRFINSLYAVSESEKEDGEVVTEIERRIANRIEYDYTVNPDDGVVSDEERALDAAQDVMEALRVDPFNKELRNLLLDIYYYRAMGRQIAAKDRVVEAYQINFSNVVDPDSPFGTPIDSEIIAYEDAADALAGVLDPYRDLLLNDFGISVAEVDPAFAGNVPFGYYLFVTEVPQRSIYAASFTGLDPDTHELEGETQVVSDERAAPTLYVTPSAFHADQDGNPLDSASFSFTLMNLGAGPDNTGDLHWTATIENPIADYVTGEAMAMLAFEGGGTSLDSGDTPILPAGSHSVSFTVASNTSSALPRTGYIEVRDTSGYPDALTYKVVVTQEGSDGPIVSVSPSVIPVHVFEFDDVFSSPDEVIYEAVPLFVRNGGLGDLDWTATVQPSDTELDDLVFLRRSGSLSSHNSISGTNMAMLEVGIFVSNLASFAMRNTVPEDYTVEIEVTDDNDPSNTATVEVRFLGSSPDFSKQGKAASLLSVFPNELRVSSEAVYRELAIQNARGFDGVSVASDASWISAGQVDLDTGFVGLDIAANSGSGLRTGSVTVISPNATPSTFTVPVTQGGLASRGIVVSPSQRYVGPLASTALAAAGEDPGTGFTVSRTGLSDTAWTARVIEGGDWLRIVSGARGAGGGEILFTYDQNQARYARTGSIEVEAAGAIFGADTVIVQVSQRSGAGASVLSSGFKDLALIFNVMRDEAQVYKELAKRLALRRMTGDVERAYALIEDTIVRHSAALNDLGGLIPGWRDMVPASSGLIATYMGWQQAIDELASVRDFLDGDANILGFEEDFLFLVQHFQGQSEDLFDSFDKLYDYMIDEGVPEGVQTAPIGYAHAKWVTARDAWDRWRETHAELTEEYRTQSKAHRKWMYDVIGTDPGNDVDNPNDAASYYDPSNSYGSDMWQLEQNIKRARQQLAQNGAELERIKNEIQTELWRRSQERQINAAIGDVFLSFGDQLATIENILGGINAAQALADNVADAFAEEKGWAIGAKVVNGFAQAAAEAAKGILEARKALLAAQENQVVLQLEDQILDANSLALIKNLEGQAAVVGVQAAELVLALAQEIGARQASVDEWHFRENEMRENNAALVNRYFADPIHRLRMRQAMLEAESSFKVAQRWVFFTLRALEYKWNEPFVYSNDNGDWSMDSVFRSRTAKDLLDLMAAMRDFDGQAQGSSRGDDRFDWFSFKEDFMGLEPVYEGDGVTEEAAYAHPATGQEATATEVFQARLEQALDDDTGVISLPFSTFVDNGQTFFRGPRRDPDDINDVLSRGQYLDKIVWLKVNLLGDFSGTSEERVSGALSYAGGSYVRNARVGTIPDPARPDVIVGEFSYWPSKYWFFDAGAPSADPPISARWRSSLEQTTEISLNLSDEPRPELTDSVLQIDVFKERSVACDGWLLRIFSHNGAETVVTPDQIEDIEILFYHVSKDRPDLSKSAENESGAPE